jgi:phage terminase small subunit
LNPNKTPTQNYPKKLTRTAIVGLGEAFMPSTDSPDSATIPTANLSPAQAQVVAALAQGRTVTAAAQDAGLNRNTIYNWLHDPEFKTAVEEAQREYVAILSDGVRDLAALALETLRNLLEDPKTPPSVRLKTALAILQRPHFPQPGWHLPERIEDPRQQQVVDGLAEIKADYDAMRMTDAMPPHNPSVSAGAPSSAPIARCAPCPCGSGLKYKRCCAKAA